MIVGTPSPAVARIIELMQRFGVSMSDLIETDHRHCSEEKVRRVTKCWATMARLPVRYSDLELAFGNPKFQNLQQNQFVRNRGLSLKSLQNQRCIQKVVRHGPLVPSIPASPPSPVGECDGRQGW
jgi:hypothetical protein